MSLVISAADILADIARSGGDVVEPEPAPVPARRRGGHPIPPCGCIGAYQRHLRRREEPCRPCRDANAAESRRFNRSRAVLRMVTALLTPDALLPKER